MSFFTEAPAYSRKTIPGLCLQGAMKHAKPDALNHRGRDGWVHIAAEEFVGRVKAVALGLAELGIKPGERVGLLSENRPEWSITDLAILSNGAVNVPIYTTQAIDQIRFILEDAGVRTLFISGRKVFKHAKRALEGLEALKHIVFFDKDAAEGIDGAKSLESIEARGSEFDLANPNAFEKLVQSGEPDDLATIIYTSGTTGEPKGVMLSHDNFVSNIMSVSATLPISSQDVSLSVLPLSHIFERTVFYIFCWTGVSVYYCASFDQVGDHLREVRPTVMTAVPRLFEKVYHKIVKKGSEAKGWKRKVFERALKVGQQYARLKERGDGIPLQLQVEQAVANRLVFSKWRAGVGGRLRYFVSGGAPLSPALSYTFLAAGIPILQGYGMTETCIVSANRPDDNQVGSVGKPFPGIAVRIASDGEILIKGPNVMRGYYNRPEATADQMSDGWFATGDVGRIDERDHLYITDRKKDLFKLSSGKYIAPQLIESLIKESQLVSQVVVVGAGRKVPGALIVPDWEELSKAASLCGIGEFASKDEASRSVEVIKLVQRDVAQVTSSLADYERVRKIALLCEELTIDRGELTPTLKVKRRVIDERYGDLIEEMYGSRES